MERRRLDALLLTNLENIRYASRFTGSTATAVITNERAIILVDSRYILQAAQECPKFEVKLYSGDVLKAASELLNELAPARLGFEADYVTCSTHRKLRSMISKSTRLVAARRTVEDLRIVKDREEIEKIRRAAQIADECFSHICSLIKPGMSEREVALEIYLFMYKKGSGPAFGSIVAAGPHAAFPHFQPTDTLIERGQMVKLDFGASLGGYNSDLTRTIFLGKPDEKFRKVYGVVLEAQRRAIAAIRPGKIGKEIDAVARDFIASKGYGEYFGHGLGHSLGIGVHDGPGLTPTSDTVLAAGMVMTVEPGIYIEGWGGVRIEDDALVTRFGAEVLTTATKEIVVVA
jgi:Xaa-Pro aminopeptidase